MNMYQVIKGLKVIALYACIYAGFVALFAALTIYRIAEKYDPDSGRCFEYETMLGCFYGESIGTNANYPLYLIGATILTGLVSISRLGARQRARIAKAEAHLQDD